MEEPLETRPLDFEPPEVQLLLGEDLCDDETLLGEDLYEDEECLLLVWLCELLDDDGELRGDMLPREVLRGDDLYEGDDLYDEDNLYEEDDDSDVLEEGP